MGTEEVATWWSQEEHLVKFQIYIKRDKAVNFLDLCRKLSKILRKERPYLLLFRQSVSFCTKFLFLCPSFSLFSQWTKLDATQYPSSSLTSPGLSESSHKPWNQYKPFLRSLFHKLHLFLRLPTLSRAISRSFSSPNPCQDTHTGSSLSPQYPPRFLWNSI